MLAVNQRNAVQRFANLEDLSIAVVAERQRVEAEHQVELQPCHRRRDG